MTESLLAAPGAPATATPQPEAMRGLSDWLLSHASALPVGLSSSVKTLRQWAAEVETARRWMGAPAPVAVTPEGWKLVPIKPTGAMLHAAHTAFQVAAQSLNGFNARERAYAAMLDHVPAAPVSPSPAEELMEQPKEGSVHSAAMEVAESWDAGFREDALWESVEKLAAAVHAHSAAPEKIAGPDATLEQVMDAVADMHVHQAAPSGDVPFGVHSGQVGENAPRAGGSAPHGVDWIGLALDLEAQAKRVESQTAERAMRAAANGLRLMGRAA